MNQNNYSKQLISKLDTLNTSLTGGLNVSGTDLTSIVTNTSDTASNTADVITNTGVIAECVDQINHHLEVDTNAINGVTMAVNSGNNSDGCQRFTIANDDTMKGPIHTTGTLTDINTPGTTKCFVMGGAQLDGKFAPLTLNNAGNPSCDITKIQGNSIDTSSGNLSTGTIRTVSATNDTNLLYLRTQNVVMGSVANGAICTRSAINQCPLGIGFSRWDDGAYNAFVATGSGNIAADPTYTIPGGSEPYGYACPRIVIATDDVNISAMKADIATIKTILNDVWDSVAHKLKVSTS